MKIGFNGLFLQFPSNGSGQYLIHLLSALAELDDTNEYVIFGPQPAPIPPQLQNFPYYVHPVAAPARNKNNIEKVLWEQTTGPTAAAKMQMDLYHVPYFAPPLITRTPTIVTIHDVIPLRLPAYHPSGKIKLYMNLVARAAHNAAMIITISQHAKQDIIETLHIPEDRIRVIYQAAGEQYTPVTDPVKLAEARKRYGLNERYILYLGGLDQRKNVPQLVKAFAHVYRQIGDPNLQLLIAGNPDKQKGALFPDPRPVAADLGMGGQIIYRYIEEEDKATLYSGTSLFVFPSLYEGFGLDPLEAMKCGAPVVCSNRTSLPEVVGDAALSVDPEKMPALVEAMCRVLTQPDLERDLRARSLQQATKFSWKQTAAQTLEVYQETLKRAKSRKS